MSRVTRSRSRTETPQTVVTDFFKTRKTRARGEKKIIEENVPFGSVPTEEVPVKEEKRDTMETEKISTAPIFDKKAPRTRARTPTPQAELSTPEVTGTPPKKAKETVASAEVPSLPVGEHDIILESKTTEKSALDALLEAAVPTKKKSAPRTVADLQSMLAAKGAARSIHAQNIKNKTKLVDEHAEMLKSPKKKIAESSSPTKSKAARALFSPKKSVPEYVVPGHQVLKSAEKLREEQDEAHEEEGQSMTAEFLKTSKLTEEVKESARQRIELPSSYSHLADFFKQVDQITSIITGQNRACWADELFKSVKIASGKVFSKEHLSQILHVYPESYKVEMREQRRAFGQGGKYELEVRPNLVDDLRGYIVENSLVPDTSELPLVRPSKLLSQKKSPRKQVNPILRKPDFDGRIRLDAARKRDRAHIFRHKLSDIVLEHHNKFLESQGLPCMGKRLHPLFRPEKDCPVLQKATLPEPPVERNSGHIGMKEALDKQFELEKVYLPSSVQRLLSDLKSPQKVATGTSGTVPISPKKFSEMQAEQKMTMLERIRAKEAIKKAANACIDKDLERRKQRLTLLKDKYVRVVCNHYTKKKAESMTMENVAKFVQFSSSNQTSLPNIIDHLKLMCEVAPMYVAEITVMGKSYLRFTDNNIKEIYEIIDAEMEKTEQQIYAHTNHHIAQMSHTPRPKAARSLKFA